MQELLCERGVAVSHEAIRKLLKSLLYVPRVLITDKRKSYGAAKREILPDVEHCQSRPLHNRCEHSHRPIRQRERRMQGLQSASAEAAYCQEMRKRLKSWAEVRGAGWAAKRVGRC